MQCERCKGSGWVRCCLLSIDPVVKGEPVTARVEKVLDPMPCPDCDGSGQAHCCDGLQEQPDNCPTVPRPITD